jgi:hypothetical protein
VFRLPGGTEDSDLWLQRASDANGLTVLASTWEISDEDRAAIAAGANVELVVWGDEHPPVALQTTNAPLGAAPAMSADSDATAGTEPARGQFQNNQEDTDA